MMDELNEKLEELIIDAAKCNLVAGLAAEEDKRALFRGLAEQYLKMANTVCDVIENRQPGGLSA